LIDLKKYINTILDGSNSKRALYFRIFSFTIVLFSIIVGSFTTLRSMDAYSMKILFWCEIFTNSFFLVELVLRVWSAGYLNMYRNVNGRYFYLINSPIMIVEISSVFIIYFLIGVGSVVNDNYEISIRSQVLVLIRFFQLLRFFYIDRRAHTWHLLADIVSQHKHELITTVYIGTIMLLFSAYFVLIFEHSYEDTKFHSYADALYWSIITMTTIGFGDISPNTYAGKLIASGLCIVGCAFWTLPAGIVGTGLAIKVEQRKRGTQFNRLLPAAASVIQAWWRMKATAYVHPDNLPILMATVKTFDISKEIHETVHHRLSSIKKVKNMNGEVSPKKKSEEETEAFLFDSKAKDNNDTDDVFEQKIGDLLKDAYCELNCGTKKNYSEDGEETYEEMCQKCNLLMKLTPEHLISIRIILILKYFAASSKFKKANEPYNFKDVIQQYNQVRTIN
jgi:hypothetical protein